MKLVLASGNKKKLIELRDICGGFGVEVVSAAEVCVDMSPCEETGDTFEENARIKALFAMERCHLPAVSDDSGLEVFALDNRPGVYSARYGGEGLDDGQRTARLLAEMENVPDNRRGARFVSCICCALPKGGLIEARGECEGSILRESAGSGGFGYDPVFFHESSGMSFAELTAEAKNNISHRGIALKIFAEKLRKYMDGEQE